MGWVLWGGQLLLLQRNPSSHTFFMKLTPWRGRQPPLPSLACTDTPPERLPSRAATTESRRVGWQGGGIGLDRHLNPLAALPRTPHAVYAMPCCAPLCCAWGRNNLQDAQFCPSAPTHSPHAPPHPPTHLLLSVHRHFLEEVSSALVERALEAKGGEERQDLLPGPVEDQMARRQQLQTLGTWRVGGGWVEVRKGPRQSHRRRCHPAAATQKPRDMGTTSLQPHTP